MSDVRKLVVYSRDAARDAAIVRDAPEAYQWFVINEHSSAVQAAFVRRSDAESFAALTAERDRLQKRAEEAEHGRDVFKHTVDASHDAMLELYRQRADLIREAESLRTEVERLRAVIAKIRGPEHRAVCDAERDGLDRELVDEEREHALTLRNLDAAWTERDALRTENAQLRARVAEAEDQLKCCGYELSMVAQGRDAHLEHVAELRAEVERLRAERAELEQHYRDLNAFSDEQGEDYERLRVALRRYGQHGDSDDNRPCDSLGSDRPCDCGLDAALGDS